jgi:hypothetical protein
VDLGSGREESEVKSKDTALSLVIWDKFQITSFISVLPLNDSASILSHTNQPTWHFAGQDFSQ